ncbi:hypothetical protein [Micromonospora sp. LOL_023]|uniref:hypothetical protein n=1 Tax=Micromonospora sp. LOL_023 TaxID=3345418 RepID=UPI003A88300B
MTDQVRPVDRHNPLPLWARLHDDLLRRSTAGGCPAGVLGSARGRRQRSEVLARDPRTDGSVAARSGL